jgi:hypothetical protein
VTCRPVALDEPGVDRASYGCDAAAEPALKKPMVGSFAGCCARAASGHATVGPPSSALNSRGFN